MLTPVQGWASAHQRHPAPKILLAGLCAEEVSIFLIFLHHTVFASDGVGLPIILHIGHFLQIIAEVPYKNTKKITAEI